MRNIYNMIYYNLLLFAHNLFNFIAHVARVLLICFARVLFNTIICLILIISNLVILLILFINPIFLSCRVTLLLSTVTLVTFLKYIVLCSRYAAHLYFYFSSTIKYLTSSCSYFYFPTRSSI